MKIDFKTCGINENTSFFLLKKIILPLLESLHCK